MYYRAIKLPSNPIETFFLWGPRQTGKSSLLKTLYPQARRIDLLRSAEFTKYLKAPETLRMEVEHSKDAFIIIDEIQKVPALLDEVHAMIEDMGVHFALCGSSARKLKRNHVNMLGGRAIRYVLHGLCSKELGENFTLKRVLNNGYLPRMYDSEKPKRLWKSYIADYLKTEIAAEGLVRNLPAFSNFVDLASLSDTQVLSFKTFAGDCGVAETTIRDYFGILEDTLIAFLVSGFSKKQKRRNLVSPKLYFFDVGLVNTLAKRGKIEPATELFGRAFENWVFHEIKSHLDYSESDLDIGYWTISQETEVDFVIGQGEWLIEAKATARIRPEHFKGIREFKKDFPGTVSKAWIVSLVDRSQRTDDGIEILTVRDFIEKLWEESH